jgi:CheY-like chemotaxis protein
MDIQMPVMDGLTACRIIRADPGLRDLPIIAMTAHATLEDQHSSLDAGMNAHLTKPIIAAALYETIARYLPPTTTAGQTTPTGRPEANWPPVAGVDLTRGLALHMHQPELLLKSARTFCQEFAGAANSIRQYLADEQHAEAMRIAHSTKSVAASLGAGRLADVARHLENCLKDKQEATQLLKEFALTLDEVIDGLAALPLPTAAALPDSPGSVESLFVLLENDLAMANAASEAHFERLRQALAEDGSETADYEKILTETGALIADVEFETALKKIRTLHLQWKSRQA